MTDESTVLEKRSLSPISNRNQTNDYKDCKRKEENNIGKIPIITLLPPPQRWFENCDGSNKDDSEDCNSTTKSCDDLVRKIDLHNQDVALDNKTTGTSHMERTTLPSLKLKTEILNVDSGKIKRIPHNQQQSQISSNETYVTKKNFNNFLSSTQTLPLAAKELIYTTFRKSYHHIRIHYNSSVWSGKYYLRHSEIGRGNDGYQASSMSNHGIKDHRTGEALWKKNSNSIKPKSACTGWEDEWDQARSALPPFSCLNWVDRQLVKEWRTCDNYNLHDPVMNTNNNSENIDTTTNVEISAATKKEEDMDDNMEEQFLQAKILIPQPHTRPPRETATSCYACRKIFCPLNPRHHCRLCGRSYCHAHSRWSHKLPHLNYDSFVPERVCFPCKSFLEENNLAERIAWRVARSRDFLYDHELRNENDNDNSIEKGKIKEKNQRHFMPYFEIGVESVEDVACRLTRTVLKLAKTIPLGVQASVAVGTIDILRKYGLKGVYGFVLRKEFAAAADLLCRVTGINKKAWPLSVHELSATIFYALTQHRAMRGIDPGREERIHTLIIPKCDCDSLNKTHSKLESQLECMKGADTFDKETQVCDKSRIEEIRLENKEHDGGGDTIIWEHDLCKSSKVVRHNNISVMNETDNYDPMAQSVTDLLTLNLDPTLAKNYISESTTTISENDTFEGRSSKSRFVPIQQSNIANNKVTPINESHFRSFDINSRNDQCNAAKEDDYSFTPVCEHVPSSILSSLSYYAPLATNFIYATSEVDMQLLAAQQDWLVIHAHLNQGDASPDDSITDQPASAFLAHTKQKIVCLVIRGTATINDVVTDIRATPVHFPEKEYYTHSTTARKEDKISENDDFNNESCSKISGEDSDWTPIHQGRGLALCGMAGAASNLFRENIDTLLLFARKGYRIRLTGHSLGGGVAALLGSLVWQCFESQIKAGDILRDILIESIKGTSQFSSYIKSINKEKCLLESCDLIRVYSYGSPACVDAKLADDARSYVTNCVLHDDVVPRLTPTSIRALLKHLLHIRKKWMKAHLEEDVMAITKRVKAGWSPRLRNSFTMLSSPAASLRKCRKKLTSKQKLLQQKVFGHEKDDQSNESRSLCNKRQVAKHTERSSQKGDVTILKQEPKLSQRLNGDISNKEDSSDGIYYEGDFFFEPEEKFLLEQSDTEDEALTLKKIARYEIF